MKIKTLFGLFMCLFYISAFAGAEGGNHPMMPPKESMDACKGKNKEDVCSFTGPKGMSFEGICFQIPGGSDLACIPKPPKVAIDACTGKNENDSCSFTGLNDDKVDGTCFKTIHGDVACRPAKMMGPPPAAPEKSESK